MQICFVAELPSEDAVASVEATEWVSAKETFSTCILQNKNEQHIPKTCQNHIGSIRTTQKRKH